ncbi:division/cell wall cluster transcriptional repressor MraZ [Alkalicaulis satelles]|uniref:Transcriptional regulator MraZ n=1 Tax=Alkalicaulis satelles TaxID=2609175 RepID=A0A5M6ZKF8_9PROT|nr:division/cell wall cluster transcriptional repressor MraZ [Alkalicaulis satelles]KAA5805299.1 division/cell wall cluster transcriptional repressor MraZ [Alkalicaulis satelles]
MFVSTTTNAIDAKGRVSVPADFRASVAAEGFNGVYVWRSFNGAFLEGGGKRLLEDYAEAIEEMDPYDDARTAFERVIFGGARALAFESTGRVTLPRELMEHAGLSSSAVFIGMGRRFEIWDPAAHAGQAGKDLAFARDNKAALRRPRRREGA